MTKYKVKVPIAQICASAAENARCTSEALYGEPVMLLETHHNWGLIRQLHDNYEGFIKLDDLSETNLSTPPSDNNTHWVSQRSTLLFQHADLKSPISHRIPFGSELSLSTIADSTFSKTSCGYFVWTDHCLRMEQRHSMDPIELAESMFLGAPYRWGGRSPEGADCSGLIQQLARSQRLAIPRDSGEQEAFIAHQINANDFQRFDIVYWPGHTGILLDNATLLHATAYTLSCIIEPLADVVKRAGTISSVKRLFA